MEGGIWEVEFDARQVLAHYVCYLRFQPVSSNFDLPPSTFRSMSAPIRGQTQFRIGLRSETVGHARDIIAHAPRQLRFVFRRTFSTAFERQRGHVACINCAAVP